MSILNNKIYRVVVPKFIRKRILAKVRRSEVLSYYDNLPGSHSNEIKMVLDYVRNSKIAMFPYYFQDEYTADSIIVYNDQELGLPFVLLQGKRLYFKKRWSNKRIRKCFKELLKEQDSRCPHCYENESFKVEMGDVVADIGAAEGNFALTVVERASRLILFESDKEWLAPLRATFEPWKDKVTIVNKYVGDVSNSTSTTLDDYFQAKDNLSFIKIDVEGAESSLLDGCKGILKETYPVKIAICTYHKQEDEAEFKSRLTDAGYLTSHSDGYMLHFTDRIIEAPYLRRALVRAVKS